MYIDHIYFDHTVVCLRLFGTSNYHVPRILDFRFLRFSYYLACPSFAFAAVAHGDDDNYNDDNDDLLTTARPVLAKVHVHTMNIPAADAFSLNLHAHSHSSSPGRHSSLTMSTRRALTRSPSPSVLFVSSLPDPETSKATRRSKVTTPSNGSAIGGHGTNSQLHDVGEDVNGEIEPNAAEDAVVPERKKIDWEIPRKLLHSSIGASCSHFRARSIISSLSFVGFLVIPLYTTHTSPRRVVQVLSVAGAVISSVDYVRLRSPRFAVIYEKFLGFLMRESEKVCLQQPDCHHQLKCVI